MGDILGAAGSIVGTILGGKASDNATNIQNKAIGKQQQFIFQNLNPSVIGPMATQADFANAVNRLVAQGQLDPALLDVRYGAEGSLRDQLGKLGVQPAQVSDQAVLEAINGGNVAGASKANLIAAGNADLTAPTAGKDQLIKAAMDQIKAGATLPPDVQAELVKAGLENAGMVTQNASGQGVGGQILRTVLGTAGIQLQQQRQTQAANLLAAAQALDTQKKQTATGLLTAAQNLEQSRAGILQNLFPNLTNVQLANLAGTQGAFNTANSSLPNGGLSGTDVANLWLARVGATNQLTRDAATNNAQNAINQGVMQGNLAGGAAKGASALLGAVTPFIGGLPSLGPGWASSVAA